jgi:hypothetical protein
MTDGIGIQLFTRRVGEMKKGISLVLCAALISSLVFCGCKQESKKETKEEKETTSQTESTVKQSETETEKSEDTTVSESREQPHIDREKLEQAADYFTSHRERENSTFGAYADGIRGEALYAIGTDQILFHYGSMDSKYSLSVNVYPDEEKAGMTFDLRYEDGRYYGTNSKKLDLGEFESFIDNVIEGKTDTFEVYDDAALSGYSEQIKADLPIVYSRLITLAANMFPELGFGLEDIGLDFGDKYRDIDPTLLTSQEIEIINDHVFVNGICSDCNMTWTEYFYDVIKQLDGDKGQYEYLGHTIYGQPSSANFSTGDMLQLEASDENYASIWFTHFGPSGDVHTSERCNIDFSAEKSGIRSEIEYSLEDGWYSTGSGVAYKYRYQMELSSPTGEYEKIFSSKEEFIKNCNVELILWDEENEAEMGTDLWKTKSDNEDAATYYTKDEFIDFIWERFPRILESMDNSMVWVDTSLADAGFIWK